MKSPPEDVVALLQDLIRIPSVNPTGDPGTDGVGEERCARYVGQFLERCGARVEIEDLEPGRPNVCGFFPGAAEGKPRLVFAPHTDTVSVVGMTIDPFGGDLREGRVWGRGASDTKGPMAAMLWALWEAREKISDLGHEIVFAGLAGEEAGQEGARAFVARYRCDFAVIGEPTSLDIVHTHKGDSTIRVVTRGRAVHSSTPERGDNAIYKMIRVIECAREKLGAVLATNGDPVLGAPTMSVGTIHGGSKFNIVPDSCEAVIDFRTVPQLHGAAFAEIATGILREACPDVELEFRHASPLATDRQHPVVGLLEATGGTCVGAPWFCDAAVFAAAGMPAVACGPGSIAQAHTRDEWIAVEDLHRGVDFYRRFLERL